MIILSHFEGPNADWRHWTIFEGKLYFFFFELAKSKFMSDPSTYAAAGAERWAEWFPNNDNFNTKCYVGSSSSASSN